MTEGVGHVRKQPSRHTTTPANEQSAGLAVDVPQEDVHRVPNGGVEDPFALSLFEHTCALGGALGWCGEMTKEGACLPHL